MAFLPPLLPTTDARGWSSLRALLVFASLAGTSLSSGCSASRNDGAAIDSGASEVRDDGAPEAPPTIGPAGQFPIKVKIDGVTRNYLLVVPQSAVEEMAKGPVPMLFALHGAGDTAANFVRGTTLDTLASSRKFILAAPDAYRKAWVLPTAEGWPTTDGQPSSLRNDIRLVLKMIEDAQAAYFIDGKRIYASGLSRGAGFTGVLASASNNPNPNALSGSYSSPFAAYSVVAGYNYFQATLDLTLTTPKLPIWIIHGAADTVVPQSQGKTFADQLKAAGWPVTFTSVPGAPHNWLYQAGFGHDNNELWDWFLTNPLP